MAQTESPVAKLSLLNKFNGGVSVSEVPAHHHDCDSPHHTHADDLLSFYKLHANTMEHLIKDYNREKQRHEQDEKLARELRSKLSSTEEALKKKVQEYEELQKKLQKSEADHASTKQVLARTKDDLAKTQDKLKSTKADLDDHCRKLDKAIKERNDARNELAGTKKQLQEKESLLEKEKKLTTELNADLAAAQTNISELDGKLKKKQTYATTLEERNKELTEQLDEADKGEKAAIKHASELEDEKDKFKKLWNKVSEQFAKFQDSPEAAGGVFMHHKNRTSASGKYYIDEVMYGGKVIDDPKVITKLLEFADSHKEFTINNSLMGEDPWHHTTKSFTAVYAVDGKAPFRYISAREYQKALFK